MNTEKNSMANFPYPEMHTVDHSTRPQYSYLYCAEWSMHGVAKRTCFKMLGDRPPNSIWPGPVFDTCRAVPDSDEKDPIERESPAS